MSGMKIDIDTCAALIARTNSGNYEAKSTCHPRPNLLAPWRSDKEAAEIRGRTCVCVARRAVLQHVLVEYLGLQNA